MKWGRDGDNFKSYLSQLQLNSAYLGILTKTKIEKENHMIWYVCFWDLCNFNAKQLFKIKKVLGD
ncbi:hypothetical protein BAQ46_23700 [Bacillus paranthracis]|uniref:Uncharacterized protein n=1 Tax=Bacillus thuringiensis subsp. darmstadiensis TaxID=132264 RepID=A0A9X6G2H9_BACUD|nr:hypothetical protein TU49_05535 [Bacillus cereus]OJE19577.1 hypothetical protein BAQ46_23700 [Bacillus paranthracis]OTZ33115.1 hypothetical protein BK761_14050 [Bacillus thuringiensis serovar darmstadiensis]OUA68144.1 hypothetical protein BK786_07710 [Bacillus thuringiensis serovar thailandensis]